MKYMTFCEPKKVTLWNTWHFMDQKR